MASTGSGRGLLRGIARAVVDALIGSQKGSGSRGASGGSVRSRDSAGSSVRRARLRASRDAHPRSRSSQLDLEHSPGRDGVGATRDLSPEEIRSLRPSYEPQPDGDPDPGEVVWTWVPYAENDGRGKDRPVLIIARAGGGAVAGCYLSTKQHAGFVSVGAGGWDSQGRESFLAPDRVLRITDGGMRREGHVLSRERFVDAVRVIAGLHGIRG
ncbi:hypothetical protein [Leucobacter tenebrionis]|uniref:hypothetical protein n=1 Tax=Leucobacter tenebrionis TaxID=2873270 RepID=UPI001CA6CC60|nr:hypothetical protein [Leucobacter tenebrionis]QZY52098.1 hypothetical protein KVY00_01060 [Leucobacter tenebrionis]